MYLIRPSTLTVPTERIVNRPHLRDYSCRSPVEPSPLFAYCVLVFESPLTQQRTFSLQITTPLSEKILIFSSPNSELLTSHPIRALPPPPSQLILLLPYCPIFFASSTFQFNNRINLSSLIFIPLSLYYGHFYFKSHPALEKFFGILYSHWRHQRLSLPVPYCRIFLVSITFSYKKRINPFPPPSYPLTIHRTSTRQNEGGVNIFSSLHHDRKKHSHFYSRNEMVVTRIFQKNFYVFVDLHISDHLFLLSSTEDHALKTSQAY